MMRSNLLYNSRKVFLTTILLFISLLTFAQSDDEIEKIIAQGNASKLISTNSELLLTGRFKQAAKTAKKLVEIDSENANYNYRYGYSLLQCAPDIEAPIKYLEKASQKTVAHFDASSEKEVNAPFDAIYYYGWALHRAGRVDEAIVAYNKFNEVAQKKNVLRGFSELRLQQCEVAKELIGKPTHDKLKNIGLDDNPTLRTE